MLRITLNRLVIAATFVFLPVALVAAPVSGLYQIVSGEFTACCGIAGPIRQALPTDEQSFIELTVQGERATVAILGSDGRNVFTVSTCAPASPFPFQLTNGLVSSNRIEFVSAPDFPSWNYTATDVTNGLRLDGGLMLSPGLCADVPTDFAHSNVVAMLMPTATIRVSEVEVCWNSLTNVTYQVQFRSMLTTNEWTNLGPPRPGNGSTDCITDPVQRDQPRRFYRVVPATPGTSK